MANCNQGSENVNRKIIIPPNSLNPNEVNVVYIPPSLHNTTHPLLVRPATGRGRHLRAQSLPIWDDELSRRDDQGNICAPGGDSGYEADISSPDDSSARGRSCQEANISSPSAASAVENVEQRRVCSNTLEVQSPAIIQMSTSTVRISSGAPAESYSVTIDLPQRVDRQAFQRLLTNEVNALQPPSPERRTLPVNTTQVVAPTASCRQLANATFVPSPARRGAPPDGTFNLASTRDGLQAMPISDDQCTSSGEPNRSAPQSPCKNASGLKPSKQDCPQTCSSWANKGAGRCYVRECGPQSPNTTQDRSPAQRGSPQMERSNVVLPAASGAQATNLLDLRQRLCTNQQMDTPTESRPEQEPPAQYEEFNPDYAGTDVSGPPDGYERIATHQHLGAFDPTTYQGSIPSEEFDPYPYPPPHTPESFYDDMWDSQPFEESSSTSWMKNYDMEKAKQGAYNIIRPMTPSPTKAGCCCSNNAGVAQAANATAPRPPAEQGAIPANATQGRSPAASGTCPANTTQVRSPAVRSAPLMQRSYVVPSTRRNLQAMNISDPRAYLRTNEQLEAAIASRPRLIKNKCLCSREEEFKPTQYQPFEYEEPRPQSAGVSQTANATASRPLAEQNVPTSANATQVISSAGGGRPSANRTWPRPSARRGAPPTSKSYVVGKSKCCCVGKEGEINPTRNQEPAPNQLSAYGDLANSQPFQFTDSYWVDDYGMPPELPNTSPNMTCLEPCLSNASISQAANTTGSRTPAPANTTQVRTPVRRGPCSTNTTQVRSPARSGTRPVTTAQIRYLIEQGVAKMERSYVAPPSRRRPEGMNLSEAYVQLRTNEQINAQISPRRTPPTERTDVVPSTGRDSQATNLPDTGERLRTNEQTNEATASTPPLSNDECPCPGEYDEFSPAYAGTDQSGQSEGYQGPGSHQQIRPFDPSRYQQPAPYEECTPESYYDDMWDSQPFEESSSISWMKNYDMEKAKQGAYNIISPMTPSPTKSAKAVCSCSNTAGGSQAANATVPRPPAEQGAPTAANVTQSRSPAGRGTSPTNRTRGRSPAGRGAPPMEGTFVMPSTGSNSQAANLTDTRGRLPMNEQTYETTGSRTPLSNDECPCPGEYDEVGPAFAGTGQSGQSDAYQGPSSRRQIGQFDPNQYQQPAPYEQSTPANCCCSNNAGVAQAANATVPRPTSANITQSRSFTRRGTAPANRTRTRSPAEPGAPPMARSYVVPSTGRDQQAMNLSDPRAYLRTNEQIEAAIESRRRLNKKKSPCSGGKREVNPTQYQQPCPSEQSASNNLSNLQRADQGALISVNITQASLSSGRGTPPANRTRARSPAGSCAPPKERSYVVPSTRRDLQAMNLSDPRAYLRTNEQIEAAIASRSPVTPQQRLGPAGPTQQPSPCEQSAGDLSRSQRAEQGATSDGRGTSPMIRRPEAMNNLSDPCARLRTNEQMFAKMTSGSSPRMERSYVAPPTRRGPQAMNLTDPHIRLRTNEQMGAAVESRRQLDVDRCRGPGGNDNFDDLSNPQQFNTSDDYWVDSYDMAPVEEYDYYYYVATPVALSPNIPSNMTCSEQRPPAEQGATTANTPRGSPTANTSQRCSPSECRTPAANNTNALSQEMSPATALANVAFGNIQANVETSCSNVQRPRSEAVTTPVRSPGNRQGNEATSCSDGQYSFSGEYTDEFRPNFESSGQCPDPRLNQRFAPHLPSYVEEGTVNSSNKKCSPQSSAPCSSSVMNRSNQPPPTNTSQVRSPVGRSTHSADTAQKCYTPTRGDAPSANRQGNEANSWSDVQYVGEYSGEFRPNFVSSDQSGSSDRPALHQHIAEPTPNERMAPYLRPNMQERTVNDSTNYNLSPHSDTPSSSFLRNRSNQLPCANRSRTRSPAGRTTPTGGRAQSPNRQGNEATSWSDAQYVGEYSGEFRPNFVSSDQSGSFDRPAAHQHIAEPTPNERMAPYLRPNMQERTVNDSTNYNLSPHSGTPSSSFLRNRSNQAAAAAAAAAAANALSQDVAANDQCPCPDENSNDTGPNIASSARPGPSTRRMDPYRLTYGDFSSYSDNSSTLDRAWEVDISSGMPAVIDFPSSGASSNACPSGPCSEQ